MTTYTKKWPTYGYRVIATEPINGYAGEIINPGETVCQAIIDNERNYFRTMDAARRGGNRVKSANWPKSSRVETFKYGKTTTKG